MDMPYPTEYVPQIGSIQGQSPYYGPSQLPSTFGQQYGVNQSPNVNVGGFLSGLGSILGNLNPAGMIANGVGSLISTGLNIWQQNRQNKQQEKMWQMNNEYNSPAAQMERMKEAGINPNTAAAAIAGSNGNAQMPVAASANESVGTANNIGQLLGNSVNNALNATLTEKEIDNAEVEKQVLSETAREKGIANANMPTVFKETIANLRRQGRYTNAEATWLEKQASRYDEIVNADIKQIEGYLKTIPSIIQNYNTQSALNVANKGLAEANTTAVNLENQKQEIANEIFAKYHIEPGTIEAEAIIAYMDAHTRVNDSGAVYYVGEDENGKTIVQDESQVILSAIEKTQKYKAKGEFEANPENEQFRTQYEYKKWTEQALSAATQAETQAEAEYNSLKEMYGKKSQSALDAYNRWQDAKNVRKEADRLNKRAGDDWRRGEYKQGYSRLSEDLAKIGVAAGLYTAGNVVGKFISPLPPKTTVTTKSGRKAGTITTTTYGRK